MSSSRNPRGTFLVFAQAAQHLTEGGRVIALSSSVLAKSFPTYGPYIASKAGVEGLRQIKLHKRHTALIDIDGEPPKPRPALEGLW